MDDDAVAVVFDEDGKRSVRWVVELAEGPATMQHQLPDTVGHHYEPTGANMAMPLYQGTFTVGENQPPFEGHVRWRWRWGAAPSVEARGFRPVQESDLRSLIPRGSGTWVAPATLGVELLADGTLPPHPSSNLVDEPHRGFFTTAHVEQELGEPFDLDQVTFLLPNGWDANDGAGVCDPADLTHSWYGRLEATGDGWIVTIDRRAEMDRAAWTELRDLGGHRFTHVGRVTRGDGSRFTGAQAFAVLNRVRLALNLALGRRTSCALPVGWRAGRPIWCRWRTAPVDAYRTIGSSSTRWLDSTIAYQQIQTLLSLVLDFTGDDANLKALQPALAYHVAANVDVDVELTVSIPVSALQLLSYYRFVSQRQTLSRNGWEALAAEGQVRLLLDDMQVDCGTIAPQFSHLKDARDRLARHGKTRDALGVVIKMRNVVTHPARDLPADFEVYEWAEAGMHARYWLALALLNTVGYRGDVAAVLEADPQWIGQLRKPPWAP